MADRLLVIYRARCTAYVMAWDHPFLSTKMAGAFSLAKPEEGFHVLLSLLVSISQRLSSKHTASMMPAKLFFGGVSDEATYFAIFSRLQP